MGRELEQWINIYTKVFFQICVVQLLPLITCFHGIFILWIVLANVEDFALRGIETKLSIFGPLNQIVQILLQNFLIIWGMHGSKYFCVIGKQL